MEKENSPQIGGHLQAGVQGRRDFEHTHLIILSPKNQFQNGRSEIEAQPFALAQDRPAPVAGPTGRQLTWLARLASEVGPRRFNDAKKRLGFPSVPAALLTRAQAGRLIGELRKELDRR